MRTGFAMTPPLEATQQNDKYEFERECIMKKAVFVTGATVGTGLAIAKKFAADGPLFHGRVPASAWGGSCAVEFLLEALSLSEPCVCKSVHPHHWDL